MACSATSGIDAQEAELYRVGDTTFDLDEAEVLQTWPIIQYETPMRFARIALQMPPDALLPDLPKDAGRIQIDILAPQPALKGDAIVATRFTDWTGRETAPAGSRYHYDPQSKLLKDGGKMIYVRAAAPAGLEALQPADAQGAAPVFFLHHADGKAAAIECRTDVPPSTHTGEYCSLRQQEGKAYDYRVWFPRALLPAWSKIDSAAREYLAHAAADGFFEKCLDCFIN
jgi:hypothetical protein